MKHTNLTLDLRSYSHEAKSHQHDYHQLVLPIAGHLAMNIGNQEGHASPQQAAVISAGQNHEFAASDLNSFVVADVPAALAPELEKLPAFIPLDGALAHYVAFLHQNLLLKQPQSTSSERQMLLLLIQLLQERFGTAVQVDHRIAAAISYLDHRFNETISAATLAAVANLSQRQLNELFRRQLGMTPQQYLIEKRMQQAWQLLETTALSIQQVADSVGYSNLSAFSDRFKKHFGHSPSHFRQSNK
ncbi:AraC family transcriptional regulator [Neptunomonas japonica]|uniref:AraC family transcriptional regulator n=1 Tax=Neptunomonas japonica TaxID=417574 RepID=UPI0003F6B9EC|nr:AraC family transcriptional regulator [Neptunomonas japonica]